MTTKHTFTDEQVMAACQISQDNLRKLIQWRAVKPVQSGGGRSRVRLWGFPQANRISVIAQFYNAGFSLRMAHTLAYALPLDDMLMFYDPDMMNELGHGEDPSFKRLLDPDAGAFAYFPDRIGHVIIANNKFIYTDALAQSPTIFGMIDNDTKTYVTFKDPDQFYWGMVASNAKGEKSSAWRAGAADIDKGTLSINVITHEEFKVIEEKHGKPRYMLSLAYDFPPIFTVIALYMGLSRTFRVLMGLPLDPTDGKQEFLYDDDYDSDADFTPN